MHAVEHDYHVLRAALQSIERDAAGLPWATERPWRAEQRLTIEGGLVVVDLHGLSVRLALDTVERCLRADLRTGGVELITGRGRHSGGRSRLREAVGDALREARHPHHAVGAGRFRVVTDPARHRATRPGLGPLFWLFTAVLALALVVIFAERCG